MGGNASFNTLFGVFTITYPHDDAVGGAMPSGTANPFPKCSLWGAMQFVLPNEQMLMQGVETGNTAYILLRMNGASPQKLFIEEGDRVEVLSPISHPFYGLKWRVIGVQYPPTHPLQRRSLVKLAVRRIERTRSETGAEIIE